MATFLELQALIRADLSASNNNDIDELVRDAINDAVSYYEKQRLEFNESRTSFSTVADQAEYPRVDDWPNALTIDQVQYTQAGHLYKLERQSYDWYVEVVVNQASQTGPSNFYVVYDETLFLYPQPNEITTVTISGIHRLITDGSTSTEFTNDGDTNAWLEGTALQMIRARAKADLYANRMNNPQQAEFQNGVAGNYLEELRSDADRLQMADTVKPYAYF